MLKINQEKCKKCQICAKNCPIGAIAVEPGADGKKVVSITNMCVECNVCRRVCPFGAIDGAEKTEGMVQCHSCSIQCKVPVGSTGACKRYTNEGGRLVRNRALVVEGKPQIEIDPRIAKPVITAVGAGTNYPCIRPAPHIVCEKRDGVDVVTTVTEAPLSYSGVLVKLDTNTYIGEEGDTVYCEGKPGRSRTYRGVRLQDDLRRRREPSDREGRRLCHRPHHCRSCQRREGRADPSRPPTTRPASPR